MVDVGGVVKKAYIANPGRLSTLIEEGREVLILKRKSKFRKTDFDAFAVKVKYFYVTLKSKLANEIFKNCINKNILKDFQGHTIVEEEKSIPEYGRIDFILRNGGEFIFVEVKSCTHVENGVAKFPDRPTERGRRHVKKLIELAREDKRCSVVFVIQRPDAEMFTPYRQVDPEFADLIKKAIDSGVNIKAIATEFKPKENSIYLVKHHLQVKC